LCIRTASQVTSRCTPFEWAGVGRYFRRRTDALGLGASWGSPSQPGLRDQYTLELFYPFQLAQNLAITPSVQLLIDPALNPDRSTLWVLGLRARLTL
jgi:porin